MAYLASLGDTQLAIANKSGQTQITLTISSPGQQQSQSSSFTTGEWSDRPKLFNLQQGFVLQINTPQGSHYVGIQYQRISKIEPPSDLHNYPLVKWKELPDDNSTDSSTMNFKPMSSMQPMKMGDMSMDINSMTMKMGDMSLSLNNQAKTTVTKQFCSQCGTEAQTSDRFCRSCGHELTK